MTGVSPVIGVILMVAITVVLAAVVFLLVTRMSSNVPEPISEIGFSINNDHEITVVSIHEVIMYDDLTIKDSGISQSYQVNGDLPEGALSAGDLITVSGLTTGSHDLAIIYHGNIIYHTSFIVE